MEETIKHYNANNRCYNGERCLYSPIEGKSEGCAVGRHIADKQLCKDLDAGKFANCFGISSNAVFEALPQELKDLGQDFLGDIQSLHDTATWWNATGLTYEGIVKVNKLKALHDLV